MPAVAEKTNPDLWERVKRRVTAGSKGGRPGQWSARKAQMAVQLYKAKGGGYRGKKTADNHLAEWTREDWGTKSGRKSRDSGERYLPRRARAVLSNSEYQQTTQKKRADTRKGRQFSPQPEAVARKVAPLRSGRGKLLALPRAKLMERARSRNIPRRSRMSKDELAAAIADAAS
ncbi:MAG: hypothetical protein JOZ42_09220 [Acetobacteraceae bacterium]|nr:hypothetical protein [Acetobacteraceae bacterium]